MTTEQEIHKLKEAVARLEEALSKSLVWITRDEGGPTCTVSDECHAECWQAYKDAKSDVMDLSCTTLRETEGLSSPNSTPVPETYTMEQVEKAISRLMAVRDEWDSLTKESVAFTLRHCLKDGKW